MIFALVDNERVLPEPGLKGTCPFCKIPVIAKCGEINVWHWAHANGETCDPWYEPETYWHYHWKMTFGKEHVEYIRSGWGEWRIADVFTEEKVAIEFQNSPISKETIKDREDFHIPKLIWVINGAHFQEHFNIKPITDEYSHFALNNNMPEINCTHDFNWRYYRRCWEGVKFPVFIDFGDHRLFRVIEGMGKSYGKGKYYTKQRFINKYGGNYGYHQKYFGIE